MEVAINNAQPFHREVRAWQRVDPNTGALLTGRMEADRWTSPSCNKFGVVDSQNISTPNGVQHTQRKQLEMLQARTSAGSLQVLRAKTVHTSSSRWSSSTSAATTTSSTAAKYVINDPTISQDHDPGNNAIEMNKTLSNPRLNNFKAHLQMQQTQQCQQQDQQQHQFAELMELMDKNQDYDNKSNSRKSTTSSGSSNNYHHTASRHSCSSGGSSTSSRDEDRKRLFKSNKIESYTNTKAQAPPRTLLPPMPMMMPTSSTTTTTSPSEIISRKSLYDVGVIEKQLDGSNERETIMNNSHSLYNRGKSVSNEDLTDQKQFDDDIEPIEWRRVSKIRRSLQYPKSSTQVTSYSRPPDLPENIGSVLKIKEELENGRRLSTAMLNNRVDFVALDNILNGDISKESDTTDKITAKKSSSKKTTYITAESLQEVRGKLRRLSDESLYKDDMAHETSSSSSTSSFGLVESRAAIKVEETIAKCDSQIVMTTTAKNNLREQRNRMLDKDWYLRRKSYGFEKMTANESSTSNHQSKMLESTDSGLGRSDELATSPTESPKGTVVSLSKNPSSTCITLSNGTHDIKQNQLVIYRSGDSSSPQDDEIKRHSIAVDEAKYVRDHLRPVFESARGTSIHLNGVYLDDKDDGRRLRRVEFCKTEIHFAAESGRVNIVATDEKPPPTNNFRRRRRTNSGSGLTTSKIGSSYLEAITSGVPVIHFGDTEVRPQSSTDQNTSTVNRSSEVTVSNEMVVSTVAEMLTSQKPDESDEDGDDVNIRGILKNKRAKPKPYLMGENIEGGSSLWGVKLRPVSNEGVSSWRHSSVITCENDVESIAGGGNLQNSGFSTKVHLASNDLLNTRPVKDTSPDHYVSLKEPTSMASVIQRRETENIKKEFSSSKIKIGLPQPTYLSQPTKLPSPKFQHSSKLENDLKSTSLIMRTIRLTDRNTISPPEILDVTKDVSRDSLNRGTVVTTTSQSSSPAMQLISQMNKIRRSSASNILSSSTSSSSFSLSSSRIRQLSTSIDSDNEFGTEETQRQKPIPAPRMKKIGPPNIVSHQLSQLRRMYAAADDSDDSAKADEEVKHYLGNLVMPTSNTEEKTSEKSKSWSRVKAKRTVKKQIINDDELSTSTSTAKATSSIIDNNQSNKMSIALHSPIEKQVIIAKSAPITEIITTTPKSSSTQIRSTIETSSIRTRNTNMTNELTEIERGSLKLTNGPRKLRDHELSYFGVRPKSDINSSSPSPPPALTSPSSSLRAPPQQHKTKTILISNSSSSANSSSTNKMHHASTTKHALINTNSSRPSPSSPSIINNHETIKDRSKWQLSNDKPDLLRHNAPTSESYHNSSSTNNVISSLTKTTKTSTQSSSSSPTAKRQLEKTMDPMGTAEPIYENLRKPLDSSQSYKRHEDLERDVKILNEMSKDADQIMKSMKSSKKVEKSKTTDKAQLTTIAENNSSQKTMRSKGVQVSQGSICPTHRRQRQSSASSTESVTRHSQVMQRIPSYSKRVEKVSSTDSAPRKRSSIIGRSKVTAARVSSRENLASHASSSEDLATNVEIVRRPRRTRNKEKSEEKTSTGKRQEIVKPSVSRMSSGKSQQSANDAANKTTNKGSTSLEHRPKVRVKSGYLTTTSSTQKSTHASRSRNAEQTWK